MISFAQTDSASDSSSSDGDPSLAGVSNRPDYLEVFMPAGDLEAAQRLAVVTIEPPNVFFPAHAGVRDALLLSGLPFEVVGSSVGAKYMRFPSGAEREEAMRMQPFFHEDTRIDLFREEEYDRVVRTPGVCALVSVTGFQAEHVNPTGIPAMFSSFGKVLEIDPITLAGHDMASVCTVLLMYRSRDVTCDIGPVDGPWGSRTASVCIAST
jgi:hypothetical protein